MSDSAGTSVEVSRSDIRRVALEHCGLLQGWRRNTILGLATVSGVTAAIWVMVGWAEAKIGIVSAVVTWGVLGVAVLGDWVYQLSQAKARILIERLRVTNTRLREHDSETSRADEIAALRDQMEQITLDMLARARALGSIYLQAWSTSNPEEWKRDMRKWTEETVTTLTDGFSLAELTRFQYPPKVPKYNPPGTTQADPEHGRMMRTLKAQIEILDEIVTERLSIRLKAGKPMRAVQRVEERKE